MKKIMFNDKYGLESAVLEGRKTMTRRMVKCPKKFKGHDDIMLEFHKRIGAKFYYDCVVCDADGHTLGQLPLPYEVGDVVAIAQSYKTILSNHGTIPHGGYVDTAGYNSKMYVKADLMPHQIRITDLWFERIQDISDEDCIKEGVEKWLDAYIVTGIMDNHYRNNFTFDTARNAFAALIDRTCGNGTWFENDWCIVYTFELVR